MGLGLSGAFGAVGAMQGLRAIQDRAIEEQQQKFQNEIALREIANNEKLADIRLIPKPEATTDYGDFLKRYAGGRPITADVELAAREAWTKSGATPQKPEATTDYGDFLRRFASAKGTTPDKLTAAQEIEARKQWGQADNRPPVPWIWAGPSGPIIIDKEGGTGKPVVDPKTGAPIGPTPSAGVRERLGVEQAGLDRLDKISQNYSPDFVGPIAGRLSKIRQNVPDMPGEWDDFDRRQADFMSDVAGINNDMVRLITGAAVGVQEERRIMAEIPKLTDRPDIFQSKLERTRLNRQALISRISQQTGVGQGPLPPNTARQSSTLQPGEKLAADGATVLVKNKSGQWVPKL